MENDIPKYPDRHAHLVELTQLPERWINLFTWHKSKIHKKHYLFGGKFAEKLERPEWSYDDVWRLNSDLQIFCMNLNEKQQQTRDNTLKKIGKQVMEKIQQGVLKPTLPEMRGFDSECFHALGSEEFENKFEFITSFLNGPEKMRFCNDMLYQKFGLSSEMLGDLNDNISERESLMKFFELMDDGEWEFLKKEENRNGIKRIISIPYRVNNAANELTKEITAKFNNSTYDIHVKQNRKVFEYLPIIKENLNEEIQSFLERLENKSKRKNILDREGDTAFPISDEEFDSNIVDKSNIREPRFNEFDFDDEEGNERHK